MLRVGIDTEFVMAAAEVLYEGMPAADHSYRAESFQPPHRPQPRLEPTMICLNRIIRIPLKDMTRRGRQLLKHARVNRCPVGADLTRVWSMLQGADEEPADGHQAPLLRHEHIDDPTVLVDHPIQVHPPPGNLHRRLIHKPPLPEDVPAGSGGLDQQWGEPLHPPIDGDMINQDPALSYQFPDVPVGQAIAELPADHHHDHIRREAEPKRTPTKADVLNKNDNASAQPAPAP
jgi:hypothetical protein